MTKKPEFSKTTVLNFKKNADEIIEIAEENDI